MTDDQLITLLRETPLPADPPDRYAAVAAQARTADRRRTTMLAAALAVVAVTAAATALTWTTTPTASPESFLTSTTEAGTARITLHTGTAADSGFDGATGLVDFRHSAMELQLGTGTNRTTMRSIGNDVWINGSMAMLAGSPGKRWVHLPRAGTVGRSFGLLDPSKALSELEKQHATFTRIGTATVNGVQVTDYEVVVPPDSTTVDVNAVDMTDSGHVFVDDGGLVRRFATDDGGLAMDFTDFGVAVDIQPPATAEVIEMSALSGGVASILTPPSGTASSPSLSAEQKARLCTVMTQQLERDNRLTDEQENQLLSTVCPKK